MSVPTIFVLFSLGFSADIKSSLDNLASQASSLSQQVSGWTADSGLDGALGIQEKFPDLENAVKSLSEVLGSASNNDIDVQSTKSMVSQVNNLLSTLQQKSNDFQTVGAQDIVTKDISALLTNSQNIVTSMVNAVTSDCEKVNRLNPALGDFAAGFSSAASAYGINNAYIVSSATCSASASSTGKASSTDKVSSTDKAESTDKVSSTEKASSTGKTSSSSSSSATSPTPPFPTSARPQLGSMPPLPANNTGHNSTVPQLANGAADTSAMPAVGLAAFALPLLL